MWTPGLHSLPFSPDLYNISDGRGKIGTFGIFKSVYRLGEDVVGTLNLGEGTVACLQVRRERGFGALRPEGLGWKEGRSLHKEWWYVEVGSGITQGPFGNTA